MPSPGRSAEPRASIDAHSSARLEGFPEMANSLLTTSMITREAVRLFVNSNLFIQNIDRQYDDRFAVEGAKIGDTLRIRLPNDYTVTNGPAISVQDTTEQQTTLTVQYQRHVDVAFTSEQRALKLDDFSERVLLPMMNNLAGDVALQIMQDSEGQICNYVSNVSGSGAVIAPSADTVLNARAILAENSAPEMPGRKLIVDPRTNARVTSSLSGLFNPTQSISQQYRTGMMKNALGFDWYEDQTVLKHTSGTFTAGTVTGANQTGTTLSVTTTGTLLKGDIITLDSVNGVNRVTKQTTGAPRQFVVTADYAGGAGNITIYPAITPAIAGVSVQYQTVTASPADGAAITMATQANEVYRRNFAYAPDAVTMATADLFLPKGVIEADRRTYDGVSLRLVSQYAIGSDQAITRLDVLFGDTWPRGEWGCIVADAI
jgi:hypothetical protein